MENNGYSISDALEIVGLDCDTRGSSYQRVYRAVARRKEWRERLEAHRAAEAVMSLGSTSSKSVSAVKGNPHPVTPGTKTPRHRKRKPQKQSGPMQDKGAMNALAALPAWADREATETALTRRKIKTPMEAARQNFFENATKSRKATKYSMAIKAASKELKNNRRLISEGKLRVHGYGARAVAKKFNATMLNSPGDRQLTHDCLSKAVKDGLAGKSPPKRGRPLKIPVAVTQAMAVHGTMRQVSGDGEASKQFLKATSEALVSGTEHEGTFNHEYAVRASRRRHPELLLPARAKNNEDRRVDWLTFKNINQWTDGVKKFLVGIGMLKDEPGYIREYFS